MECEKCKNFVCNTDVSYDDKDYYEYCSVYGDFTCYYDYNSDCENFILMDKYNRELKLKRILDETTN